MKQMWHGANMPFKASDATPEEAHHVREHQSIAVAASRLKGSSDAKGECLRFFLKSR